MVELADIFREHGEAYRAKFGQRMPRSHLRAMRDIEACRTEALGGQLYRCEKCEVYLYRYHSCKNRHCPKCQNFQANEWLQKQKSRLLPINYFLVTFTLPEELRALARANQRVVYDRLFRASSQALLELAADKRFVGGRIGLVGVLHTWTRALLYHPHVHYIATAGGLDAQGNWRESRADFLVHVHPLGLLFRAKMRAYLKHAGLLLKVAPRVWDKAWVVHCEAVGNGEAALKYLAPYIFRVAISNNRILKVESGQVTFQYKESATDKIKTCRLGAEEMIRRFLQHVLPDHFVKVRYFGLLSPANRHLLKKARQRLCGSEEPAHSSDEAGEVLQPFENRETPLCPQCGSGLMVIERVRARSQHPP